MSMKILEMVMDDDDVFGVDAMSLVEHPAIGENFIALSEQQEAVKVRFAGDKKRKILYGLALVPDMPIYRKDARHGEFYVFMSRETVRKAAERFIRLGMSRNATLEHESDIQGAVVESWLSEGEHDKLQNFGITPPKGGLLVYRV